MTTKPDPASRASSTYKGVLYYLREDCGTCARPPLSPTTLHCGGHRRVNEPWMAAMPLLRPRPPSTEPRTEPFSRSLPACRRESRKFMGCLQPSQRATIPQSQFSPLRSDGCRLAESLLHKMLLCTCPAPTHQAPTKNLPSAELFS